MAGSQVIFGIICITKIALPISCHENFYLRGGHVRPADVNARAVMIARIATGEAEDALPDDGKDPAAKALGKARAASMTPARRTGIAKKTATKR